MLLRGVREAAGRTREQQARLVEEAQGGRWFDPENLKRWETERRLPVAVWHESIAAAYGLMAGDVRRAVAASREYRRRQGKERADVNRRCFIGAAAAAAGISALPGIAQAREGIDEGGHRYKFNDYRLAGRTTVRVHTGEDRDNRTDLYQDRRNYVWDNRSGTAPLPDDRGRVVDTESWGYHHRR